MNRRDFVGLLTMCASASLLLDTKELISKPIEQKFKFKCSCGFEYTFQIPVQYDTNKYNYDFFCCKYFQTPEMEYDYCCTRYFIITSNGKVWIDTKLPNHV